MNLSEKYQAVIDSIQAWIREKDAYFLAVEGQIVYWESITGDPEDNEWFKITAAEAARVLKATRMNPQVMQQCTGDAVIAAAQEMDRVYVRGVRSSRKVKDEFFNYVKHENSGTSYRHKIAHSIISYWFKEKKNPLWTLIAGMIEEAWKRVDLPAITAIDRNKIMGDVCKEVGFDVRRGKNRYNCPNHGKVGVMRRPFIKYATMQIDENLAEELISKAIGEVK